MLRRIEAKKERRKKFWMGALLVFIMTFSIMGILIGSRSGERWEYNGYKFTRVENVFVTEINNQKIGFDFLPQTVLTINISANLRNKVLSPMVYLTFDSETDVQNLLYIDTVRNDLQTTLNSVIVSAVTKESEIYFLPTITCENATPFVPVIYFNVSNQTSIVDKNNCIVLNGQTIDFFKMRDLLVYTYYGVING